MLVLAAAAGHHSSTAYARPEGGQPDPILDAIARHLAARETESLPPDWEAHLSLEIAEVSEVDGTRTLGRFRAPIQSGQATRLERRLSLPRRGETGSMPLDLDVRITPRVLNSESVSIVMESYARSAGGKGRWRMRRSTEILRQGRSMLLEACQLASPERRLLLALTWSRASPDPLEDLRAPRASGMVDLVLELVREEKGKEQALRRELLSTGLGTEASSLIRLAGGVEGADGVQQLEVRLRPKSIASGSLLLDISVRGALAPESGQGSEQWVDHSESARLAPGAPFQLDLGGGGEELAYRLEVRPYF